MSSTTHNQKTSSSSQDQTYSIQPHPAKTNNPADLLVGDPKTAAFHASGPLIPSDDVLNRIEKPKTREELRALSAQLNTESEK